MQAPKPAMASIQQNTLGLTLRMMLVTALVFGIVAAVFGLILVYSGFSGSGSIWVWLLISFAFLLVQWYIGPSIIRWSTGAKEVKEGALPELRAILAKYAGIAGIPVPKLYLVENNTPNAFAFGRTQGSSGIAVHTGLLRMLPINEIEAVIAHEIGHIRHRDVLVMTFAGALPILLYYAFIIFFGNRDDRNGGSFLTTIIGANVASFLGQLIVLAISRAREYYADEFSAYATANPKSLMMALTRISYANASPQAQPQNKSINSFYIASPSPGERGTINEIAMMLGKGSSFAEILEKEKGKGSLMELVMTHPLTVKRLERLYRMGKAG
jgi:heat shock protein HtpX